MNCARCFKTAVTWAGVTRVSAGRSTEIDPMVRWLATMGIDTTPLADPGVAPPGASAWTPPPPSSMSTTARMASPSLTSSSAM